VTKLLTEFSFLGELGYTFDW